MQDHFLHPFSAPICQKIPIMTKGHPGGPSVKRVILSIFILTFCTSGFSEEKNETRSRCGQGAVCAARESTVLSMMGWGIGLFAGIAALCSLIDSNPERDSSSSNSHSH